MHIDVRESRPIAHDGPSTRLGWKQAAFRAAIEAYRALQFRLVGVDVVLSAELPAGLVATSLGSLKSSDDRSSM